MFKGQPSQRLVAQGLDLELWERIAETDGELRLADWRPWVRISSTGPDKIGLFERWQKNSLRYCLSCRLLSNAACLQIEYDIQPNFNRAWNG